MATPQSSHANGKACVIPGDFTVVPIKFYSDSNTQHNLYVKEHKVREEKSSYRPLDKTLFVLNIPPYCSEDVVKELFSQFGSVTSVELNEHPGFFHSGAKPSRYFKPAQKQCFKVGYVVFRACSGIAAVKSHPFDVPLVVCSTQPGVKTGIRKWIQQYKNNLVQPDRLQHVVDNLMKNFDLKKKREEEQQKLEAEQKDEDQEGWVKVTKGPKGAKARPYSEAADEKTLRRERRKKKRKELLNFYAWQHKNTQKEHIADLRKKFEEDKQKIALLRAQRKFRPY